MSQEQAHGTPQIVLMPAGRRGYVPAGTPLLAAIKEHRPEILGMSALLTTTMPYMGVVIQALEEAGIRDDIIVLVGGAPLNEAFAEEIGADGYCRDAAVAVETAKRLVTEKRQPDRA